jgi:hypothetical protein
MRFAWPPGGATGFVLQRPPSAAGGFPSVFCCKHQCNVRPKCCVAAKRRYVPEGDIVRYSNAKRRFQSFFMLMTVQPFFLASS